MKIELKNSIYEDSELKNGLIEHTFPDSVVPFNVMELLDAQIAQFPKLVDGLVDITLIFYMILI